jgi:hypothetical protein
VANERDALLRRLLDAEQPLAAIIDAVILLPWDSDHDLVTLTSAQISHARETLSPSALEQWANAIECREDIAFESEECRRELHALANPALQ